MKAPYAALGDVQGRDREGAINRGMGPDAQSLC